MWSQLFLSAALLLRLQVAQESIDPELLGPWVVRSEPVIVSVTFPFKKIQRTELFHLRRLEFSKDGTAEIWLILKDQVTSEYKREERKYRWRSEKAKDGTSLLYLYSDSQVYLVARYAIKDRKLWLTFSLENDRSKKEAPRTFDPFLEDDVLVQVFIRPAAERGAPAEKKPN